MARWIAFDQKTTNILRSTLAQGTRIDTLLRGPVDYALAKPSTVIAVLPATGGNDLGVAVFRRARAAAKQKTAAEQPRRIPPVQPASLQSEHRTEHRSELRTEHRSVPRSEHRATTRAGGFLGLSDEPVFEDEAPPEKKGWWRKFWDE
jgi:type IV secretory pathway VirB10-like protein